MNNSPTLIKRALISVSDKTGIIELARDLYALDVEIVSTGGTAQALREAKIPVQDISQFTGFPEIMEGRVKTLHPNVHGGILGLRDKHQPVAQEHDIQWIDLVVCNLYPFAATIKKTDVSFDEVIENIDVGGPSMIRSAAKNMGWVTVVTDPNDYQPFLQEIQEHGGVRFETRREFATKAFAHTAQYDAIIHQHLSKETPFPETLNLTHRKLFDLRYGENPHQQAAVYKNTMGESHGILTATILQGKQLSYNNINDADGALACLKEFNEPACVIVKHANPCGAASGTNIVEVFHRAYAADALAAFGGVIALNQACTADIAKEIVKVFVEIVMAPSYTPEALQLLAKKPNMRVLELGQVPSQKNAYELRSIAGGVLLQAADTKMITYNDLHCVTKKQPTTKEIDDILFGWRVLKHVKSNAILIAKDKTTVGIGPGQVSRIDAVDTALRKAGDKTHGAVLCSDAFFPFRDSIDTIAPSGVTAIIQPGGSVKDQEVIDACNEHDIAMVFTGGVRCFKH